MDDADFRSSPVGFLVRISGWDPGRHEPYECSAFVPEPLPARPVLSRSTGHAAAEASAAIARLDEVAAHLPAPWFAARTAIRHEAVGTSALEGVDVALDDVFEADFRTRDQLSPPVSEACNHVEAAEFAFDRIRTGPITVDLLEDLQKILVRGTRSGSHDADRIRTTQVFVGVDGGRVADARFVPPPPGPQLRAGVEAWAHWLAAENAGPLVIRMALGHYQFAALHPFADGNGRLGRLICALQPARHGDLRAPLLNLSPWLDARRGEYRDHLLAVSSTGDFEPWIRFFSEAVRAQASGAVRKIELLNDWRDAARNRLQNAGSRGVAGRIIDDLIGYPLLTARFAADRFGVSRPAVTTALRRLAQLGLVEERAGRTFVARDVLDIISGE